MGSSSLFGSGLKNERKRSSVTSSTLGGFHFGVLSFLINRALTPVNDIIVYQQQQNQVEM